MRPVTRRTALLGGLAAAGGATSSLLAAPAAVAAPTAPIAPTAPTAPVPIDTALQRLDRIVADMKNATGVPGLAVSVVHGGRTVYAKGFGVRQVGRLTAVTPRTVFQVASVSKPVSSTAIAAAVRAGAASWDQPVRLGLPTFRLADDYVSSHVTVADMYIHRSGVGDHVGDLLEDLGYDQATIFDRLRLVPLRPFRTVHAYNNYTLTAGAQSVASHLGLDFEAFIQQYLFRPLAMTDSSASFAVLQTRTNRAALHEKVDGVYRPRLDFDVDGQAAAGGVSASVVDLATWMRMLLAGGAVGATRVLDVNGLLRIWQPAIPGGPVTAVTDRTSFYGLGWNVGEDSQGSMLYSHSGAFLTGSGTNVQLSPALDVGIATLSNATPVGLPEAINRTFLDILEFGAPQRDWLTLFGHLFAQLSAKNRQYDTPPPVVTPSGPLAAYAGTYDSPYWGRVRVAVRGRGLQLTTGVGGRLSVPLHHYTGDQFWFETQGESATGQTGAYFSGGATPSQLQVLAWKDYGGGLFTRVG